MQYQEYREDLLSKIQDTLTSATKFKSDLDTVLSFMEHTPDVSFKDSLLEDEELQKKYLELVDILKELGIF